MTDNDSTCAPSSSPGCSSTPNVEEFFVPIYDEIQDEEMEQEPQIDSNQELGGDEDDHPFKRARKSEVWKDMEDPIKINGEWKTQCKHCKSRYTVSKSGTTSHIKRHLSNCAQRKLKLKQQSMIKFLPSDSSEGKPNSGGVSALHNGKLDMLSMTEGIANWIVMHEKPFSVVEEEGFNMMLKRGIPQWTSVSRHTIKTDGFKVYEAEKKKLKALLKDVDRISLTTDLWRARPQRIEYMVLTGHFVDRDWKLQKRVLSFVHIPPPRKGKDIANCIFKCLKECDIMNKVFKVSVDNAIANDSFIQIIKDTFSLTKRLLCGGALFHVRCCAHILNIMVQHGLKQVKTIVKNVHDTVDYLNGSEARMRKFAEIVQQFNLRERSSDDWQKIEKLLDILKVFYDITNVISGSEYPTSNFFLSEVFYIKEMLDKNYCSPDPFVKDMVKNMKERFDKYWGECNLLMAIGGVLDLRLKMKVVEITFPHMFPSNVVRENINKVKDTLYELYDEYKALYPPLEEYHGESRSGAPLVVQGGSLLGMSRVLQVVRSGIRVEPRKSELDVYLEECTATDEGHRFDALNWWKERASKFVVLSRLVADVLAIPITTVASEVTFSAGSRVIDPYRSSLLPETVQMLICTGDWSRSTFGIKRKNKFVDEDEPKEIMIPIP
ncbi:zinc finger BED domain-containing protein RICESLEEPER 2 [Beta vulgaris subsp. vulgaris]|uniref:zinc finger BED domain-containing protein RICESLEEPER 2 n=1 Tax=Beta vulgaris subsp. vulgaris TaxID=3555 RepID=UPI002548618E|nr:zinc finger BED domain-containing protein RICESLEEPER 2 [Beta vulgaris subsp. vulgaris]